MTGLVQAGCPNCRAVVQVAARDAGQVIACGGCGTHFRISAPAQQQPMQGMPGAMPPGYGQPQPGWPGMQQPGMQQPGYGGHPQQHYPQQQHQQYPQQQYAPPQFPGYGQAPQPAYPTNQPAAPAAPPQQVGRRSAIHEPTAVTISDPMMPVLAPPPPPAGRSTPQGIPAQPAAGRASIAAPLPGAGGAGGADVAAPTAPTQIGKDLAAPTAPTQVGASPKVTIVSPGPGAAAADPSAAPAPKVSIVQPTAKPPADETSRDGLLYRDPGEIAKAGMVSVSRVRPAPKSNAVLYGIPAAGVILVLTAGYFFFFRPPPPVKVEKTAPENIIKPADPDLVQILVASKPAVAEVPDASGLPPAFGGPGNALLVHRTDGSLVEIDADKGTTAHTYELADNGLLRNLKPFTMVTGGRSGFVAVVAKDRAVFVNSPKRETTGQVSFDPAVVQDPTAVAFEWSEAAGKPPWLVVGDAKGRVHFFRPLDPEGQRWESATRPRAAAPGEEHAAITAIVSDRAAERFFVANAAGALRIARKDTAEMKSLSDALGAVGRLSAERDVTAPELRMVTTGSDGTVRLWKTRGDPAPLTTLPARLYDAAVSDTFPYLIGRTEGGKYSVWSGGATADQSARLFDLPGAPGDGSLVPVWNPGPDLRLAMVDGNGRVFAWKLEHQGRPKQ